MASLMMALERAIANDAMDKMAENARELGLDYEPRDEAFKNFAKAVREYADEQRELAEDSMKTVKFSAHQPWCSSLSLNLMMAFNKPAPCDCKEVVNQQLTTEADEPVAWFSKLPGNLLSIKISGKPTDGDWQPLYTRPQQCPNCASLMEQNTDLDRKLSEWVGLTKEEIEKCKFDSLNGTGWALDVDINLFYKSVEAKLKEKNRG